ESLLKLIRNYDLSKNEYKRRIVDMAVRMCINKVHYRIRKVSKELEVSHSTLEVKNLDNLWQSTGKDEGEIYKAFAKAYSRYKIPEPEKLNKPDKQLLAHYFRAVLKMDVPTKDLLKNIPHLLELVTLSYY